MQPSLFEFRPPTLTVSALTQHIRQLFDFDDILQDVWIEGEISNWSPASSGHIYFTLKDSKASIRCVIWSSTVRRLNYLPQNDGEAVLAHGRVSVYEMGGAYQLYVDDMEPAGLGALYAQFERLKQQLAAEGLFDEDRKRPLPTFPQRIGLVTSEQAAALRDILNILARRYPIAEIIVSPTPVQGEHAPSQIIAALKALDGLSPPPDVIILARGGGSIEDLWAFNDESLARVISALSVPIVSGIGHETDFTITDFVADHRAPTPSAAAELVTPDRDELSRLLSGYQYQFVSAANLLTSTARSNLQDAIWRLQHLSPQSQIDNRRQQIDDISANLRRAMTYALSLQRQQFQSATLRLEALNPKSTLERGYAIVQKENSLVTSVKDVASQDSLTVTLSDGSFEAEVK